MNEVFPTGMLGAPARGPMMMNEAVPNENFEPMMPQVVDGSMGLPVMSALGSTPSGQRWALKHLHPNGETVTSSAGIPDHTHVPVVTPEYRSNYVIEGSGEVGNDNVDILVVGTVDLAFLYRRYPAGSAPGDIWRGVYYAASNSIGTVFTYPLVSPPAGGAETATALVVSGNSATNYPKARGMYCGVTVTFDAPALRDQGRLVAGQLPLIRDLTGDSAEVADSTEPTPGFPDVKGNFVKLGQIPLDEDELFQSTPGVVVHEAREGVYMPLRFNEPVQLFTDTTLKDSLGSAPPVLSFIRPGATSSVSFRGPGGSGGPIVNFGTEGVFNFLTGVILFRGIDRSANLSVKTRLGVEAQVERGTAVAPFQHASPPLDKMALDAVTYVSQSSPMAYPSCYNDFGAIMDVIKQVLGFVKKGAKVGAGLGLPYVGAIGSGLEALGLSNRKMQAAMLSRAMKATRRY